MVQKFKTKFNFQAKEPALEEDLRVLRHKIFLKNDPIMIRKALKLLNDRLDCTSNSGVMCSLQNLDSFLLTVQDVKKVTI